MTGDSGSPSSEPLPQSYANSPVHELRASHASTGGPFRRAGSTIRRHRLATLGVTAAVLAAAGYGILRFTGSSGSSLITVPVTLSTIKQEISLTGNIEPATDLGLNFNSSGTVTAVDVVPGQHVSAGTLLASQDTTAQRAQLAQAENALAADKIALTQAEAALPLANQLNSNEFAQARLAVAQDRTKVSTDERTLSQDRAIAANWCQADASSTECVQAQQAFAAAQSNVQADQQNVAADQLNVTATQNKNAQSIAGASEAVTQAQTTLSNAQRQLAQDVSAETVDLNTLCPTTTPCTTQSALDQQAQLVNTSEQMVSADTSALADAQTSLSDVQNTAATNLAQSQLSLTNASQKLASDQASATLDGQIASGGCGADPSSSECNSAQSAIASLAALTASDKSQLESAISTLPIAHVKNRQSLQQSLAQITASKTQISSQETVISNDQAAITDSEIIAPISGLISQVNIVPGHNGNGGSGATPSNAITLSTPGGYQVQVAVSDAQISQVKLGEQAIVQPAGATSVVYGTVTQITPQATISAGVATFPVTISITPTPRTTRGATTPAATPQLFAGASAQVSLVVRQATNVLSIPTSAVHTIGSRNFVLIPSEGKVKKVAVAVGAADSLKTQIVSGLNLGQDVVIANTRSALPAASGGLGLGRFGGGRGGRGGRGGGRKGLG